MANKGFGFERLVLWVWRFWVSCVCLFVMFEFTPK